ncbi:FkbM family methyltransferase [Roseovarius sp. MMSF_3281]|uniref:FkbM family methyltransferase n=1 Tax=Roseovarius sp. MMSF_3281 TaxID=3046694 RepID=UPI00273E0FA2|nr:FkbM family methyltransferase [Roseovarius sp. MMSF_3281]
MASLKRWLERRRNPWKGVFFDAYKAWRKENGQARLTDYADLPEGAVVFDVGGFRGEWTDTVLAQSATAHVHVFEPHPGFAETLRQKFRGDSRVTVHELAIGSSTGTMELSDAGDASSAVADHGKSFTAPIQKVDEFLSDQDIRHIDLMKVNIEGGEYDLLPALIDTRAITALDRLQVQFHLFEPGMQPLRDTIRQNLEKSHTCTWSYPFVWEEWRRKTS